MAEAIAIREGLQYCLDKHFHQFIIETDSLSMVNILNGEWESPWSVTMEVNSINKIRNSISVRVQHSFKEENTLADFFANLVVIFAGSYEFNSFHEIPTAAKKTINLDKCNTPYIRIKQIDSLGTN
ncbi:hypothetical protein R3W88_026974 [Solanum pinnatisectum]|uniref:RNase H type-1 domain-containing protein n=1 Tax=Solanum pinnatisectum TaxID=50273 RepID=A0AAV9LEP4_9SOLN|nr:hypothetical protein R3W88_026974 [Solanum pinnatisectum]